MQSSTRWRSIVRQGDLWTGVLFTIIGGLLLLEARDFAGNASRFPLLAAGLVTGLGIVLIVGCAFTITAEGREVRDWKSIVRGPLVVAVLLLAWVYLLSNGLGYFVISVPLVMGIIFFLGQRQLVLNALAAILIVTVILFLFYGVFGVRLPVGYPPWLA